MTIHGQGLALRLEIRRLMRQHGIVNAVHHIPLAPPTDGPQILEGFASTRALDLDRVRFRPWALTWSERSLPPLHLKHDETRTVGVVESLDYDADGNLRIRATVDDPLARRHSAWSIGANVRAWELRDEGTSNFHAVVTQAELTECSLTDVPANPSAVVTARYPVPATREFYTLMQSRAATLGKLVNLIQQEAAHARR